MSPHSKEVWQQTVWDARWLAPGLALLFLLVNPTLRAQPTLVVTTNQLGTLVLTNRFGDLNDDGRVDVLDLVRLTDHLTSVRPLSDPLLKRADLNQDKVVDDVDRRLLADLIAGRNAKADEDFDGDELANADEVRLGTNPLDPDTDHDGSLDGWEVIEGTNPLDPQSRVPMIVIARPPITVLHPLIQDTDTNMLGVVVARPPVKVTNPPP